MENKHVAGLRTQEGRGWAKAALRRMGLQVWHSLCLRKLQDPWHRTEEGGVGQEEGPRRYSLDIFGPRRRVVLGHEDTVGQDGTHDEHAEERGASVKEATGGQLAIHTGHPQRKPWEGLTRKRPWKRTQETMGELYPESHGRGSHRKSWEGLHEAIAVPSKNP